MMDGYQVRVPVPVGPRSTVQVGLGRGGGEGLMPVEARLKEDEENPSIILMIFEFVIFSFEKVFLTVSKRSGR